jgi:hypothetical protein
MTSQEIVAIFDREGVPDLAAAMILTEVAGRRVFKNAVIISLDSLGMDEIVGRRSGKGRPGRRRLGLRRD